MGWIGEQTGPMEGKRLEFGKALCKPLDYSQSIICITWFVSIYKAFQRMSTLTIEMEINRSGLSTQNK